MRRLILLALLLLPILLLQACAGQSSPTTLYSLEGPPFAIAGENGPQRFSGHMERACLLGRGQMAFRFEDKVCAGEIRSNPNESGHIRAVIRCDDGQVLMFTFRSLGPDQGIGLGRFMTSEGETDGQPLIFYFHPWEEEAARRLDQEKIVLRDIISQKEKI